jgi:hypothetical protein
MRDSDNSNRGRSNREAYGGVPASGATQQNIFDLISTRLGINDTTIFIPAVPQLSLSSSRLKLIYVLLAGAACLAIGIRAIVFSLFLYVVVKKSENAN